MVASQSSSSQYSNRLQLLPVLQPSVHPITVHTTASIASLIVVSIVRLDAGAAARMAMNARAVAPVMKALRSMWTCRSPYV